MVSMDLSSHRQMSKKWQTKAPKQHPPGGLSTHVHYSNIVDFFGKQSIELVSPVSSTIRARHDRVSASQRIPILIPSLALERNTHMHTLSSSSIHATDLMNTTDPRSPPLSKLSDSNKTYRRVGLYLCVLFFLELLSASWSVRYLWEACQLSPANAYYTTH